MMAEPDWKTAIRARFEAALDSLEEPPESLAATSEASEEVPDIYTFYESLAALRHEVRQGNRKTAEAFNQFGDSLGAFDSELKRLREQGTREKEPSDTGKALRLPLVELADRIYRLQVSFQNTPSEKAGWFGQRRVTAWQRAWTERDKAIQLLAEQVVGVLNAAGLTPIPTLGLAFDPTLMIAVARDEGSSASGPLVVVEEITRGYLHQNELVRLAEVRVASKPIEN